MIIGRLCLLVVVLAGGAVIASCSSDMVTGRGGGKFLAQVLDSAFRADSAAGLSESVKTIGEEEVAFLANEGLQPVGVQVHTDGGTILMQMLAGASVQLSSQGTITDSESVVFGWTSDYATWLIFLTDQVIDNNVATGSAIIKSQRGRSLRSLMAPIGAGGHRRVRAGADIDSLDGNWLGFIWDHGTTIGADSASGVVSWSGTSGDCVWQGVALAERRLEADSAISCVPATYDVRLTLHYASSIPSLVHVSVPGQPIPALRLEGFGF
jgi:hypothetical protein